MYAPRQSPVETLFSKARAAYTIAFSRQYHISIEHYPARTILIRHHPLENYYGLILSPTQERKENPDFPGPFGPIAISGIH